MKPIIKIILTLILLSTFCIGVILTGLFDPVNEKSKECSIPYHMINTSIPGEKINVYASSFGTFVIDAPVPNYSSTFPVYRGVLHDGDSLELHLQTIGKIRKNVTSTKDADMVARNAMAPYGGIPADAVFKGAETEYIEQFNGTSEKVEDRWPVVTSVSYFRLINNRNVIGDSNWINLDLGENGELIYVKKIWRNYTYAGEVPIIPLDKAINKLRQGDTMESYADQPEDVTIYMIVTGYYAKNIANNETLLEPVWMFYGNTVSGSYLGFNVYARQFTNFTATPTSGTVPLTVSFTDTSGTSPNQWLWDFGDGMNSTEQSPTHTYTTAGIYNISLKAWNDLGSDTITRTNLVQARTTIPIVANFTAIPLSGKPPLTVQFNDTSFGGVPTLRFWTFGDGANSSEQAPVHTYTTSGNYTVELELANSDADVFEKRTDYITVLPLILPVAEFTASPTTGTAPLTVTFSDTSENHVTTWLWDFGDRTNSLVQSPSHTYTTAGNYTVILNVSNADGDDSVVKSGLITVNAPPTTVTTIPITALTTKPTTRPTKQPLSPLTAIIGVAILGLVNITRIKR
jgi:PKD repeat protein